MQEAIYYKSPVGTLVIKNDDDAVSQIEFLNKGSNVIINEEDLEYLIPQAEILKQCIRQLDEYFAGTVSGFNLKIAQAGTPFQQSVWTALQTIGYGKTCSYLSLSRQLGNTKAIRAVGTANGRNNIAIIVPCHRVIGSNGNLVGYAGDLWRKKWLLQHEAKSAHGVQTLFPA